MRRNGPQLTPSVTSLVAQLWAHFSQKASLHPVILSQTGPKISQSSGQNRARDLGPAEKSLARAEMSPHCTPQINPLVAQLWAHFNQKPPIAPGPTVLKPVNYNSSSHNPAARTARGPWGAAEKSLARAEMSPNCPPQINPPSQRNFGPISVKSELAPASTVAKPVNLDPGSLNPAAITVREPWELRKSCSRAQKWATIDPS